VLYTASDGVVQYVDDGTEWRPLVDGVLGWEAAPGNSISAFTQVGYAAPDTVNVQGGCPYFFKAGHGSVNSLLGYELAKAAGQSLTVFIAPNYVAGTSTAYGEVGIWVRDTTSGKASFLCLGGNGGGSLLSSLAVYNFSALATYAATAAGPFFNINFGSGVWLQIVDTGTTLKYNYSVDGVNWQTLYTDTGPYVPSEGNRYAVGMNPYGTGLGLTVKSLRLQ
jgi:hypothetical protein